MIQKATIMDKKRKLVGRKQIDKSIDNVLEKGIELTTAEGDFERGVISTGSTLLDLAISSKRVRGGGIPSGVIVEIFGPSSSGKTAVLAEIGASCKYNGGVVSYKDPEGRLDTAYARQCGLALTKEEYSRPNTVDQFEKDILQWKPQPKKKDAICVICADSLAAFSTEAEINDGHKMASAKRAQSFHQLFRKAGIKIRSEGWIIACSNQEQVNFDTGTRKTPGGNSIGYWSSVRIRIAKDFKKGDIKKTWKRDNIVATKIIGIRSNASIKKNSCDDPFREVPIFIIFGIGIDDIRGNLQWLKETNNTSKYECGNKSFSLIDPAIRYVEAHDLETKIRDKVINVWNEIEDHFTSNRKPKRRF